MPAADLASLERYSIPKMRTWSFRFFLWFLIGVPITAAVLYFGMMATGGGHGTYGLWIFGLILSVLCWLLIGASFITSVVTWKREARSVWWAIPSGIVLVLLTLLGLWGMQG